MKIRRDSSGGSTPEKGIFMPKYTVEPEDVVQPDRGGRYEEVKTMRVELSLLDLLALLAGECCLSNLRLGDAYTRRRVGHILQSSIPAGAATPAEWNDALVYLTGMAKVSDAETARQLLIDALLRG